MTPGVRIIAGRFRGKILRVPDVPGLRPTPARLREMLFNWLMHDVQGARCLDAFAGSGALGLEALSRGAQSLTLLEPSKPAYEALKKSLIAFDSSDIKLIKTDACAYLEKTKQPFDLIFLDPPFASPLLGECLEILLRRDILVRGGLLYTESPELIDWAPDRFRSLKRKKSGQVVCALWEKL
jgi:16S rRNA (guanine966-N2)-methyltransferase